MATLVLLETRAQAQELSLNEIPYKDAMALEPNVEALEDHAGVEFTRALVFDGGQVGQVLRGQTLKPRNGRGEDRHWVLDNQTADVPLALDNASGGVAGRVAWDGAFGGQALAGLGPVQLVPVRMRLGTGILTLLFDKPQCMVGLRTWLDGRQSNTVMRKYPEGNLNLIFWNRQGHKLGEFKWFNDGGLVELAYIQSSGGGAEVHAVTIHNLDPEGIGVDEILFSPMCPMVVSGLLWPSGGVF